MMTKLAAVGALGLMASGLFAQGLNTPSGQTKESWEEINFEFNSSILSDGYPSLLRLADLLSQHNDYKVKVTGNTDIVGSAAYNDKLALSRAEAVKAFLVKYGASAAQITTAGDGKRDPEVDNNTKEGRFMNRRVVLLVTDGNGRTVGAGTISQVIPELQAIQDLAKQQADCCAQILKRLDKLDDILAALKSLQGENDRLNSELADLRNQQNSLRDQVNGMHPVTEPQAQAIVKQAEPAIAEAAANKVEENQRANNHGFSNVGINIGPAFGAGRANQTRVTGTAHGMFFTPFGADKHYAVQAQANYNYFPGIQEGQFDVGLVDRVGAFQAGAFTSFKFIDFGQFQQGAVVAQADFLVDYLFNGGKIGVYGTEGFKNYGVLNSVELAPGAYEQTFARIDNQFGFSATVAAWGRAYFQGNAGAIFAHYEGNKPGINIKFVQPIFEHLAFTAEGGYNETYISQRGNTTNFRFGLLFGGLLNPKDFAKDNRPTPMDVPQVRYELGTRRVGSSPPVADAGPNQLNVPPAVITLNGSGSYDPLGEALTYSWVQVNGPAVVITNANAAIATFPALAGQSYGFRLTVRNTDGLQSSANTVVTTQSGGAVSILLFQATPSQIAPNGTSTLNWVVQNASTVTISPLSGNFNATSGSTQVSPSATTTYTLTATGAGGTVTATAIVTVSAALATPQIVMFTGSPLNISAGQSSTLSWSTNNATAVSISPQLGTEPLNGSASVSPTATTSYTLTATGATGNTVTAVVTITVGGATVPQVVMFTANPQTINSGQSSSLCWQVTNATSISISGGVGSNLAANACQSVSPTTTTTYVLTATNSNGQIQASVTVNVGSTQILQFSANPEFSPAQGAPVVLTWQTTNATSVVLVGGDMQSSPPNLPVNGSYTVNPNDNVTYTLIAYGPGGASVSAVISVYVR
jgi:OmpA family